MRTLKENLVFDSTNCLKEEVKNACSVGSNCGNIFSALYLLYLSVWDEMGKASFMQYLPIRPREREREVNEFHRPFLEEVFISRLNRDRIPEGPRLSARGAPSPSRSRSEPGLISGLSLHGACQRGDAALPHDCGCYDNLLNEL